MVALKTHPNTSPLRGMQSTTRLCSVGVREVLSSTQPIAWRYFLYGSARVGGSVVSFLPFLPRYHSQNSSRDSCHLLYFKFCTPLPQTLITALWKLCCISFIFSSPILFFEKSRWTPRITHLAFENFLSVKLSLSSFRKTWRRKNEWVFPPWIARVWRGLWSCTVSSSAA